MKGNGIPPGKRIISFLEGQRIQYEGFLENSTSAQLDWPINDPVSGHPVVTIVLAPRQSLKCT